MKSHMYKIVGPVIGLIIALVWLTVFSISGNPFFFILMGSGVAIGYVIGWGFDEQLQKKENQSVRK